MILRILAVGMFAVLGLYQPRLAVTAANLADCQTPGWFPSFGLKDHSVFWYQGYYYIVSTYLSGEDRFAYARSSDLCSWEELSPVLSKGSPGSWDEMLLWAPFVFQEGDLYYMYYTGVTYQYTQSILLATTKDPSDPASWQTQGMVFQPEHPGMVWENDRWADCRDPTIIKVNDLYFLYYAGLDTDGWIIGIAVAQSPAGPWQDWGKVLARPVADSALESPAILLHDRYYYLFYNDPKQGGRYRIGPSPAGPWSQDYPFFPGWAHEVWPDQDGNLYTSYLTTNAISISPLTWDNAYQFPRPFLGSEISHLSLPLLLSMK